MSVRSELHSMNMQRLSWTLPYPSQRMPVFGRRVVATSQPLAAQAGLQTMLEGGNAIDAAIAAAIALTVTEPTSNGIGSDAFALVWHGGRVHGLNASGRSPRALPAEVFQAQPSMPHLGWGPVTVPGAVSAWFALSRRFGERPPAALFRPAIEFAEKGFPVAPQTAESWGRALVRFAEFPDFARTFLPNGRGPAPGDAVTLPDHARTLQELADTEGESFYRGNLAKRIAEHARATGGWMTTEDLSNHEPHWVDPLTAEIAGHTLYELPPNGQGIVALQAFEILNRLPIEGLEPDCPDLLHLQIEAIKAAFADAQAHVADPESMIIRSSDLLEASNITRCVAAINRDNATDPKPFEPRRGGTVLVVAADDDTMIALIQSNYEGFGSGIVVPGTGISLQNRGACFVTTPGHPNCVAPGKRPFHTIIPGMVTRSGSDGQTEPVSAFGVMGGHMQPQGHLQVLSRIARHRQNPQAALDAPRWQFESGRRVLVEPGIQPDVLSDLRNRGHEIVSDPVPSVRFGGGQFVWRLDSCWCGASDLRRDGQAVAR